MKNKIYTGIGARKTPENVLTLITAIATKLEGLGYTLRSGAADGADTAFEQGVSSSDNKEIYIPWNNFNNRTNSEPGVYLLNSQNKRALELAELIHPKWKYLSSGIKKLHMRNTHQVLGKDLNSPSKMVIFYAPINQEGEVTGGTATAVNLAIKNNIDIYNLYDLKTYIKFTKWIKE